MGIPIQSAISQILASSTANTGAINTTDTLLQKVSIPANSLVVGTTYRVVAYGVCTSSAANASNFRLRFGVNGTVADTAIMTLTPTAGTTGSSIPFEVEFYFTVRVLGASGTCMAAGHLLNNGVTGVSNAAVLVNTAAASATINTTVANFLSLTYQSAATTTTCTFTEVVIERA